MRLQKAFEKIDIDSSGGIDAGEFVHWYIDHCEQTKKAYHDILDKYHGFYLDSTRMTQEQFEFQVENQEDFIHTPMTEEQFTDLATQSNSISDNFIYSIWNFSRCGHEN